MPEHTISHDGNGGGGGGGGPCSSPATPKITPFSTPEIGPILAASPSVLSRQSSANTTPRQHNRRQSSIKLESLERRSSSVSMDQVLSAFAISAQSAGTAVAKSQESRTIQSNNRPLPTPKPPSQCPLLCCFYAEFDNKVGPKICYQSPEGFMEQDIRLSAAELEKGLHRVFDGADEEQDPDVEQPDNRSSDGEDDDSSQFQIFNSCSDYIITGNELTGNILNLSIHYCHILTRPTAISNEKYERNALLFCVGFVLRRTEDPRPFRPVLSKVATTLRDMEVESQFLSKTDARGRRPQIRSLLSNILISLNSETCECNLLLGKADTLNLKLFRPPKIPAIPVQDHAVPILLRRDWQVQTYDWDLAINWVSLHIDGTANALQISRKAEVDMEMVRACLRVLSHHGVIAMVDMFFYSNRYECTEKVASLFSENGDRKLLQKAIEFIVKRGAHTSSLSATLIRDSEASPELLSTSARARMFDRNQGNYMSTSLQTESLREGLLVGRTARQPNSASPNSRTQEHIVSVTKRDDYNEIRKAVAEFFCALQRMTTIGDLWISLVSGRIPKGTSTDVNWKNMFEILDHRRLATFGQVHGLIRRVHAFPLLVDRERIPLTSVSTELYQNREHLHFSPNQDRASRSSGQAKSCAIADKRRTAASLAAAMMDGMTCDDAIVCACEMPFEEILRLFPNNRIATVLSTSDEPRN